MKALLNSLNESELALMREVEREALTELDEDALVELHTRIRRARDKYVKLYRREAADRVTKYGGRGKARPKNQRNAQKAEVFEDALSRVSRFLAAAARRSATELKQQRLAAARDIRNTAPPVKKASKRPARKRSQVARKTPSSIPGTRRRQAASKTAGARRQAKKDSR